MLVDVQDWAQETFAHADLGDARRSERLLDLAVHLAAQPQAPLAKACGDDAAACLGGYRLIENDQVEPKAIAQAGFAATVRAAQEAPRLLAISDTTVLSYTHRVAEQLGDIGIDDPGIGGWHVHSSLLIDGVGHHCYGLIDQDWHVRDRAGRGRKRQRKQRAYGDKESFKWQANSQRIAQRLGPDLMSRTLELADAEADIYEYMAYKVQQGQSFLVRVAQDRALSQPDRRLWEYLASQRPLGPYSVEVAQRGGRKARTAQGTVRAARVDLRPTARQGQHLGPLRLWAVLVAEPHPPKGIEPLCWRLYTDRSVETFEQARQVAEDYSQRPQIEVFHKAWKTGCRVEQDRQQTPGNLQRIGQIRAFVAVWLLQLSQQAQVQPKASCEPLWKRPAWQCLWLSVQPQKALPKRAPSYQWVLQALGRLGGFQDTKHTGRIGWQTIWSGYARLQERLIGYLLAQSHKM